MDARGPEASDIQSSKLAETKLRWAEEGRFLTGRRSDPSTERLPPGQHLTESWPVLDLGPKPYIDMNTWRLEVSGDVEAPQSFTWQEILDLPQTSSVSDIHCVTSWSRYDNAWEGISTADLIALIRPGQSVRYVQLISCDGYTTNLPLDDFTRAGCLLAHSWEGRPLTRVHGAPLRLVIPHLYFWKSAKWLKAIRFSSDDEPGYWETRGYHNYGDPWREQRYRGN
ncbi:sulfite oxidase-like oxidoreductase [Bosea sp. RAC05]|uniref:sulfite oxidase-like oxidoreductase n=1 Tax=Bosea sp. RAC05 TaxID=1842539 RepID=UPI00083DE32E